MPFAKKRNTLSIPEQASSIPEKFRNGDDSNDKEMNRQKIYTVEKVLAIRYTKNEKSPEYLLKWKNWPYNTSTWETEKNISCEQLMTVFSARQNLRLLIANKLNKTKVPNFASLPSFYGCQIWEDEMNKVLSEHGQAPLYVENWMDKASKPNRFTYITKNQIPPETQKLFRIPKGKCTSCRCTNGCGSSKSCCFQRPSYTAQGQLPDGFDRHKHWIVKCSDQCACDKNCPGRISQRGRQFPIVIFRSRDRGWGVRAAAKISANSFVMEYVGEVITIKQAERRPLMYQFEIKTGLKKVDFVIDAAHYGNESRFVNHSCEPNMVVEPVVSNCFDERYNRHAFFACRDIEQGEEVTIDYHNNLDAAKVAILNKKHGAKPCLCKAEKCRGYFL